MDFLIGAHIAEFRRTLEDIKEELAILKQLIESLRRQIK